MNHLASNPSLGTALGFAILLLSASPAEPLEMTPPQVVLNSNLATVSWQGSGILYKSETLDDDWTAIGNGTSPHVDTITNISKRFYRVEYRPEATISVTLAGSRAAPPDLNEHPSALTFNGLAVDLETVSRSSQQELTFDFLIYGLPPGNYTVEAIFSSGTQTGIHTIHANTLLMIVDDWGQDANPLYNTTSGALLANMPNLSSLASEGLSFTRAYAQPVCSPTRATMMTGRQPFQHGVGTPENSGNFSTAEITLPEIMTTMSAPHDMLTVGKWHLSGNDTGYSLRGGWPEFYGITNGGVPSYTSWSKNSNGSSSTTTVYTTTDQVNETKTFIDTRAMNGKPWFSWVAFNAPHTPFHEPPADLAPIGGYSSIGAGESTSSHQYRMMLEALDTEIGRLLLSVDPAQTNIIIIGDNGTPGSVAQAPYGDGHAKGSIYNGGSHVPLIVKGPAVTVTPGSSTDTLVHCIDLFSTILELNGVNESTVPDLAAQNVLSTSIIPILSNTDTADRCVIVESQDVIGNRAIILGDYPDYKLVIVSDLIDPLDSPVIEFFNTITDVNEMSPLDISNLTGTPLAAYNACITKDAALGGGYSDEPTIAYDTVYIELPTSSVSPVVPNLTRGNGNAINVTSVTVDGNPATIVGRIGSGTSISDEADDFSAQYWVKVRIAPANGSYTTAHVLFPDQGGAARGYDAVSLQVNAHP